MTDQLPLFEVEQRVEKAPERRAKRIASFNLFVYGTHQRAIKEIEKDIQRWKDKHERELADYLSIPEDRRTHDYGRPRPYTKEIAVEERAIDILKREMPVGSS